MRAPEITEQLTVLGPEERERVAMLVNDKIALGDVTTELVAIVKQLLNKFQIVHVAPAELVEALFPAGRATTVQDAAKSFERWLAAATAKAGGDAASIRLVVDEEPQ